MKAIVAGLIVVALLAAGGTAFFVKRFLTAQKRAPVAVVEKPVAKTYVLVANSNLAVGHKVAPGSLRWQEWSEGGIHKSFCSPSARVGQNRVIEEERVSGSS
jgi:Flp pilus assembly protein CpaB